MYSAAADQIVVLSGRNIPTVDCLLAAIFLESIVTKYKIFGKLEPFLLSFGWKLRECDVGPPHCAFQARDGSASDSTDGVHSFGSFG
jgi:hypothetical protein